MAFRIASLLFALAALNAATAQAQAGTPADSLVGQQVISCSDGVPLAITATAGLWWRTIAGVTAPEGDRWLIVFFDVHNDGTAVGHVAEALQVRDDKGREATAEDAAGPQSAFLADFYDLDDAGIQVLPDTTTASFALFAVASEARTLTLLADPAGCA